MRQRIWLLLLAFPLAWNFGPLLLDAVGAAGPIAEAVISFLIPEDLGGQGLVFYFKFIVALVLFALILKALGLLFSFALPRGQRYGTTKLLRRVQGVCAELLIVLFFFCLIPFVILAESGWEDTSRQEIHAEEAGPETTTGRLRKSVRRARNWLEGVVEVEKPDKPTIYWRTIKSSWGGFLALALFCYALTHWLIKRALVSIHGPALSFFETGRFGVGGSARFAGLIEEWALRYRQRGARRGGALFMGRSLYHRLLHVAIEDDRHMLTIAGSRSGKGATVIIPNLLVWEGSALVIDPKGTNAVVTAGRRRQMGQNVYVVDPFGILRGNENEGYNILRGRESDGFNPLESLAPGSNTIREDIGVLADALVVSDATQKDGTHWDDGARTALGGLIAQLISSADYKNPTLPMIRDLLALSQDEQVRLWAAMSLNRGAGDLARDAGSRIIRGLATDEMQNIISNADRHSEWLGSPAIQSVLTKSTFKFSELKEKPTTIYLVVPPRFLDIHRRFLRLFINLALGEMSRGGRSKTKVLMILDEFQQLGKMAEVEKAFRLLAGYNFIVWPFVQDFGGLSELYGNGVNAFLSSSRAVQVFSLNDAQSLEFVSKHIGARAMRFAAGADSPLTTPLRTPDEVSKETSLESGRQYILRAGRAPLVLEKVKYYEGEDRLTAEARSTAAPLAARLREFLMRLVHPFTGYYTKDPDYT